MIKEIQYIKDSIIAEFGYDKDEYLWSDERSQSEKYIEYIQKLEIEMFEKYKRGEVEYILYNVEINYIEGEKFNLNIFVSLLFNEYIQELTDNISEFGGLVSTWKHVHAIEHHKFNLLDGYKTLLRDREIDKLLK